MEAFIISYERLFRKVVPFLIATPLVIMTIVIFINTFGRKLLVPFPGALELVEALLVICVYFGVALCDFCAQFRIDTLGIDGLALVGCGGYFGGTFVGLASPRRRCAQGCRAADCGLCFVRRSSCGFFWRQLALGASLRNGLSGLSFVSKIHSRHLIAYVSSASPFVTRSHSSGH